MHNRQAQADIYQHLVDTVKTPDQFVNFLVDAVEYPAFDIALLNARKDFVATFKDTFLNPNH